MKRQSDTAIASRVYSFGGLPARVALVRGEDEAFVQLRLATRFWNALVAIERVRFTRYRAIMRDADQERVEALKAQRQALREEMKERRQRARKRGVDVSDLRAAMQFAKEEMVPLLEKLKDSREARHRERSGALAENQDLADRRIKRARQAASHIGLFWGTYNDIVQRADAARKLANKLGGELRFRGFRGEGTLTAQLMGGASSGQCLAGGHTFFQLDPPTPGQKWRYARMRIGSHADRSPVWLEIPVVYHREIPPEANVRSVSMTRRVLAGKPRWQLNVTVNLPKAAAKTGPAVAIDIGYRLLPEGVRVAYWQDDLDRHGQVLVPSSDIEMFRKVEKLRSTCDLLRNESLPALAAWLDTRPALPEEWRSRSRYLLRWKSSDRLAVLVRWWGDNRLPDDEEIYTAMRAWRKQHLHLSNWWRNLQDQMSLRVREQFRVFAARTAREYGTVVIEEFDLREIAKMPEPEAEGGRPTSGTYRQMVSPSVLRGALVNAAKREGLAVVALPAAFTTRQCNACGYLGEWDSAPDVMHRCEQCGELWDQDRNAARNLLAAFHGGASGGAVVEDPGVENQLLPGEEGGGSKGRSQSAGHGS